MKGSFSVYAVVVKINEKYVYSTSPGMYKRLMSL